MLERYVKKAKKLFLTNMRPGNITHVEERYVQNFEDHLLWLGGYESLIPNNYPADRFEREGNNGIRFRKVRNSEICDYEGKGLAIYELDLHLRERFSRMPIKALMARYNPKNSIRRTLSVNLDNELDINKTPKKDRVDHLGMQHSVVFMLNNGVIGANYYDRRHSLIKSYSWSLRPDTRISDRVFPINEADVMSDIASEFDARSYEPRNDNYALFRLPEVVYLGVQTIVATDLEVARENNVEWIH